MAIIPRLPAFEAARQTRAIIGPAMEELARRAAEQAQLRLERRLEFRPGPGDGEATICAGGPSRFTVLEPEPAGLEPRIRIRLPDRCNALFSFEPFTFGDEDAACEPEEEIVERLRVEQREVDEVRVENPEDSEQYVMVERDLFLVARRERDSALVEIDLNLEGAIKVKRSGG